jgi:hypothetical protein
MALGSAFINRWNGARHNDLSAQSVSSLPLFNFSSIRKRFLHHFITGQPESSIATP